MKSNLNLFIKVFLILAMLVMVFAMTSEVFAFDWSGAVGKVEEEEGVTELNDSAVSITGAILSVVKYVATGIALIMIVVIAAKYMLASAGDRADIKKHAVAYVTGAMILFGSAAIVNLIQNFADSTLGSGSGEAGEAGEGGEG